MDNNEDEGKMFKLVLLSAFLVTSSVAFFDDDGGADKLFKKYAMTKIFEDCYGKETVAMMWNEIRDASNKCQGLAAPPIQLPNVNQMPVDPVLRQQIPQQFYNNPATIPQQQLPQTNVQIPLSVILAAAQRQGQLNGNFAPVPYQQDFYNPQQTAYGNFAPFPQSQYDQQQQRQSLDAFYANSGHRQAREMPSDGPSEKFLMLKQRLEAKVGNMTCMMKELSFLKEDLQPNYEGIHARIQNLPVPQEMKDELCEGLDTCKDFSSCISTKKFESSPLVKDLAQPLLLFKCFKGKKLMACMKKDLREKLGAGIDGTTLMARDGLAALENQASTSPEKMSHDIFNLVYGFELSSGNDMF